MIGFTPRFTPGIEVALATGFKREFKEGCWFLFFGLHHAVTFEEDNGHLDETVINKCKGNRTAFLSVTWDVWAALKNLFISSFLPLTRGKLLKSVPILLTQRPQQPRKGGFSLFLRPYVKFNIWTTYTWLLYYCFVFHWHFKLKYVSRIYTEMLIWLHCSTKLSDLKITNITWKRQKCIPLLEVPAIIVSEWTYGMYGNKNKHCINM